MTCLLLRQTWSMGRFAKLSSRTARVLSERTPRMSGTFLAAVSLMAIASTVLAIYLFLSRSRPGPGEGDGR